LECICCEADGQENGLLFIGSNFKIKKVVSLVLSKIMWLLKLQLNFEWIIIIFQSNNNFKNHIKKKNEEEKE
jgi:hypothetical protein